MIKLRNEEVNEVDEVNDVKSIHRMWLESYGMFGQNANKYESSFYIDMFLFDSLQESFSYFRQELLT